MVFSTLLPRLCVAITGLTIAISVTPAAQAEKNRSIDWQSDLAQASRLTKEQRRPLLMFITMDGCHYCSKMKSRAYTDTDVVRELSSNFVPVRVNGPKHPKLIKKLRVRIYPTTVILSPENRVISQISGYAEAHVLRSKMNAATKSLRLARKEG